MRNNLLKSGFALPTVLIVSVIVMITATAILQGSLSSKVALENQYYESIAREAADAGLARARSCFNQGTKTWTSLTPNNSCSGQALVSPAYVFKDGKVQSTFEVGAPTVATGDTWRVKSTGTVNLVRSDGSKLVLATQSIAQVINVDKSFDYATNIWGYSSESVTDIAAGYFHSCAVARGKAYCWGDNTHGQLGDGTTTPRTSPVAVSTAGILGGKVVTAIDSSYYHTCAVAEGKAYCWGLNNYGQLGNNSNVNSSTPVEVLSSGVLAGKTVTAVSTSVANTCVIASGQAYCWGYNPVGSIGNNSTTDSWVPVAVYASGVLSGKTVTAIDSGYYFTCAIANGAAYCWGHNDKGQLGNNSTNNPLVPVAVSTAGGLAGKYVTAIEADHKHVCAIANGAVYCWGYNVYGQLGDNSSTDRWVPVAVNTAGVLNGKTVTAIGTGAYQTCALASGKLYCWGLNNYGQLGNDSTAQSSVPVAVSSLAIPFNMASTTIAGGLYHTCTIVEKKSYCWGDNTNSQLGDNTSVQKGIPTRTYSGNNSPPTIIY